MNLPLPPYAQLTDFLPAEELSSLLEWVLAHQDRFAPATIMSGDQAVVNAEWRVGLTCRDLGPLEPQLRKRMLDALPVVMAKTGAAGPEPSTLELELAAHGDGAHYRPHTDLPIGARRKQRTIGDDRVLSSVLYFHAEPKGFSGGALRLFRLGAEETGDESEFVEIPPLRNSLVVFHSWIRHEVRPVRCPSREFRDYRFALNCWFRRKLASS
jgi:Rps23 Pro-64 3,4-dihydroxylase Tpa1-like proline 4-hydroxylase